MSSLDVCLNLTVEVLNCDEIDVKAREQASKFFQCDPDDVVVGSVQAFPDTRGSLPWVASVTCRRKVADSFPPDGRVILKEPFEWFDAT